MFLNFEAVVKTRLSKHDSPAGSGILQVWAPHELFTDNDTAFCSKGFRAFAHDWGINLWSHCAYIPARNGIAEQCSHTVMCIVARMHCLPAQCCTQRQVSFPIAAMNRIYWYEVRVKDVLTTSSGPRHSYYQVCGSRCHRVGIPQILAGSSDQNNQPIVIAG